MLRSEGTSFLLVTGGGSTRDKPTVTFRPPMDPDIMTHELTIQVPSTRQACRVLAGRGANILTSPVEYDWGPLLPPGSRSPPARDQ